MGLLSILKSFEDHNKELRVLNAKLKVQVRNLKATITTLKETLPLMSAKLKFLIIKLQSLILCVAKLQHELNSQPSRISSSLKIVMVTCVQMDSNEAGALNLYILPRLL